MSEDSSVFSKFIIFTFGIPATIKAVISEVLIKIVDLFKVNSLKPTSNWSISVKLRVELEMFWAFKNS